ncbi:ParB/RepB/Spo0J family partition protein [bacterium]|nr:ParB/RepB/Spo0J family partition protein [bacterium]
MQQRRALGKGLSSLIPSKKTEDMMPAVHASTALSENAAKSEGLVKLKLENIAPNRQQPRKEFNEEAINELASSIKEHGVLQPIMVTPLGGGRYELIAGERRLRGAREAGLEEIPAIIKNVESDEILELALIENIQRENLNAIEEAAAYEGLMSQFNMSQEEVAEKVGKSRVAVANSVRLLRLPKIIQSDVATGKISAGHARAILAITNPQEQIYLRDQIIKAKLTVRDIEKLIQRRVNKLRTKVIKGTKGLTPQMVNLCENLKQRFGSKVTIKPSKVGGQIIVEYYSDGDLQRIYNKIMG